MGKYKYIYIKPWNLINVNDEIEKHHKCGWELIKFKAQFDQLPMIINYKMTFRKLRE
jgi:hypothetical protein